MAKVDPKKAKATFEKYLNEIRNLRGVPWNGDGDHFRDQLSEKIRTLIKLSFDDSREKLNNYHPDPPTIRYTGKYGEEMKKDEQHYHLDKLHRMEEYIVGYIEELDLLSDTDTKTDDKEDLKYLEPLEIDTRDDFSWNMQVFISHKFIRKDQELASTLQSILRKKEIFGYIADKKKEYTLPIDEKIQNSLRESQFLIAIISSESLTSASVNQEIGFALGNDIPVALMIEKGLIPEGVFTRGRDVEEFTRENFSSHCEKIIKYILDYVEENKNSIKLSKRDKEMLREKVYEPSYDQIKKAYDSREFITFPPSNPWRDLTPSWHYRTEPEMVKMYEAYDEAINQYQEMWSDFGNKFIEKRDKIGELLRPVFEKYGLLDQNGDVNYGGIKHPPREWLHNCQDVIFNDTIRDGEELYQILKKDAIRKYGKKYSLFLDEWKSKYPNIFTDLLNLIPELVYELGTKHSYTELDERRKILKATLEKLTLALQEKLK